jgi:hypothetical protein
MTSQGRAVLRVACCAAAAALAHPAAQQPPAMADVLGRASTYVLQLERDLAGTVSEEHYVQDVRRLGAGQPGRGAPVATVQEHRDLRSDVLLVRPEGSDRYIQFRDVFEVDGRPVRDRDDRLARLFLNPAPSAAEQLQEIREDSARYNIGEITRDFNVPVLALMFLHPENQSRFAFALPRAVRAGQPVEIEYREIEPNTLIRTRFDRDLPARGRFRIDPVSGRVLLSELILEDDTVRAEITVTYERDDRVGLFVPTEMRESIGLQSGLLDIRGRATYTRFRTFRVTTDEKVDEKPQ